MMLSIIIKKWTKPAYYHIGLDYGPVNTKLAIIRFDGTSCLETCHLIPSDLHPESFKADLQQLLQTLGHPIHCLIGAIPLTQTYWSSFELPQKASLHWTRDSVKSLLSNQMPLSPSAYYDWQISNSRVFALAVDPITIQTHYSRLKQANVKAYAIDVRIAALCRLIEAQNEYIVIDANHTSAEITWIKDGLPLACHLITHDAALNQADIQAFLTEINAVFLRSNSTFHLYRIYGTGDNWPLWQSLLEVINHHSTYEINSIVPAKQYGANKIADIHSYNLAIGLALWQGGPYYHF